MFGMGWGELLVVGLVALFVLGPERLPGAIRTVSAVLHQARGWMDSAKQQLDTEELRRMREPFDELRAPLADLRAADPRRAMRDLLASPGPDSRARDAGPDDSSASGAGSASGSAPRGGTQ